MTKKQAMKIVLSYFNNKEKIEKVLDAFDADDFNWKPFCYKWMTTIEEEMYKIEEDGAVRLYVHAKPEEGAQLLKLLIVLYEMEKTFDNAIHDILC